jgi:cysteine dioxygenase
MSSDQAVQGTDAPIGTIRELVAELLRRREPSALGVILQRYSVPSRDLDPYCRWDPRHYTRNCVVRNEAFELLVVCYEPGQHTSIHDYDSELAWVHPVMGEVIEERFVRRESGLLQLVQETRLRPGMLGAWTRESSIHRFSNPGPGRAVTLNLYAPPMRKWRVYDQRTGSASVEAAGPRA